ncbi:hypothetical protein CMO91_00430 [Candidatus Woesearchaeota archaeon]|nr:hypothetical protein [Candidatus Woesearchaeota archaeon]
MSTKTLIPIMIAAGVPFLSGCGKNHANEDAKLRAHSQRISADIDQQSIAAFRAEEAQKAQATQPRTQSRTQPRTSRTVVTTTNATQQVTPLTQAEVDRVKRQLAVAARQYGSALGQSAQEAGQVSDQYARNTTLTIAQRLAVENARKAKEAEIEGANWLSNQLTTAKEDQLELARRDAAEKKGRFRKEVGLEERTEPQYEAPVEQRTEEAPEEQAPEPTSMLPRPDARVRTLDGITNHYIRAMGERMEGQTLDADKLNTAREAFENVALQYHIEGEKLPTKVVDQFKVGTKAYRVLEGTIRLGDKAQAEEIAENFAGYLSGKQRTWANGQYKKKFNTDKKLFENVREINWANAPVIGLLHRPEDPSTKYDGRMKIYHVGSIAGHLPMPITGTLDHIARSQGKEWSLFYAPENLRQAAFDGPLIVGVDGSEVAKELLKNPGAYIVENPGQFVKTGASTAGWIFVGLHAAGGSTPTGTTDGGGSGTTLGGGHSGGAGTN